MRRSNLAALLYLLLVFASGAVLGAFANRLYMMKTTVNAHPDLRKQYLEEMRGRLHLNSDQTAQLQQIAGMSPQQAQQTAQSEWSQGLAQSGNVAGGMPQGISTSASPATQNVQAYGTSQYSGTPSPSQLLPV